MARVVAFIPDLLFGSNVVGALQAGGYEPALVSDIDSVNRELPGAQALIVDLTADARVRLEQLEGIPQRIKTLAFYSHVEADVRTEAERAGFDVVVPRSRMAREGAGLIDRLLAADETD